MEIVNQTETNNTIVLGRPHYVTKLVRANSTYFIASRGAQKTTRVGSLYIHDCVEQLAGCLGCLVGPTFMHLEQNTLNPLFNALKELGYEEGEHYVARSRPPAWFEKPLVQVITKNYDNLYTFYNGTTLMQISMERKGSANGQSFQFGLFDETKLYSEGDLQESVYKAFRGTPVVNKKYGYHGLFLSKLHLTDKLTSPDKINWLLDKEKQNDWNKINLVMQLEMYLQGFHQQYNKASIPDKKKLSVAMKAIEMRLHNLRKNLTLYIEANHEDVIKILGKEDGQTWYNNQVMNSKPYELNVAIHNQNPTRPEDGFYPDFHRTVHVHNLRDYNPTLPIIGAADYQHSVSPIALAQISKLPGATTESLNYIDEVYTLAPEGLEQAVDLFIDKYKYHNNKTFYYVFDATATGKRNNADEYYKIIINRLTTASIPWHVIPIHTGKQPGHYQKWNDTKAWLVNEKHDNLDIRINEKCHSLITSIEGAPTKTARQGTKVVTVKDKQFEDTNKYPNLDQSKTTHFSDVFDMINDAVLKKKKITGATNSNGFFAVR